MEHGEIIRERYALVMDRIREIPEERLGNEKLEAYFCSCAEFLKLIADTADFLRESGGERASLEELKYRNHMLYADILPEHYEKSYGNPVFAAGELGEELGGLLCFLYAELRSLTGFVYENRLEDVVIRMELFAEVYAAFRYEAEENGGMPSGEEIRRIIYWFVSDYSDIAAERRIRGLLCPEECFAADIIMKSDLTDPGYLYAYGEYISRTETETAQYMAGLSREAVRAMADAFTEKYRTGYEAAGKQLSEKKTVGLSYALGAERVVRQIIENFAGMGLGFTVSRTAYSVLDDLGTDKGSFRGGIPNNQFIYDHRNDQELFLDKSYINRRLEVVRTAYEKFRQPAEDFAGVAVLPVSGKGIWGTERFGSAVMEESQQYTGKQSRLQTEYYSKMEELKREYTD